MVLNLPQCTWHFVEDPSNSFELYEESFVKFGEVALATMTADGNVSLSPSLPEDNNTKCCLKRPYGPLIPLEVATPSPRKRSNIVLAGGYSPILDALYTDAKYNLQDYDEDDELR
jgi:hypothetical protein